MKLVEAINEVADAVRKCAFESRNVGVGNTIVIMHRKKGAYGYCTADQPWLNSTTEYREIAVTPSCVNTGLNRLITTLSHEYVHAYNLTRGKKDSSGRRHNKWFKEACVMIDLPVEPDEKLGWITPTLEDDNILCIEAKKLISDECKTFIEGLKYVEKEKKKGEGQPAYVCPGCGLKARAKKDARMMCADCEEIMNVEVKT